MTYTHIIESLAMIEFMVDDLNERNSRKRYINQHETHTLKKILDAIKKLKFELESFNSQVNHLNTTNAENQGKINQLTEILKLCHQDYVLNGRYNEAKIVYNILCLK